MEWIEALFKADATRLVLLLLVIAGFIMLIPGIIRLKKALEGDQDSQRINEYTLRKIDERASHKVNGAVSPLVKRIGDLEDEMAERAIEARGHRDKIIAIERDQAHAAEAQAEHDRTVVNIYDRLNGQSDKLNRILGHLGIPSE